MKEEKHMGSEAKRRASQALVAVLIVALLAAGTWMTAGVSGDRPVAPHIPRTEQTGGRTLRPTTETSLRPVPILAAFLGTVHARTGGPKKRAVSRARLSPRRSVTRRRRGWV
jgi:hypothetical protein